MSHVEVIAQSGARLLVRVDAHHARILDCRHARLYPQQRTESLLARGHWKPFTGDLGEVSQALSTATEVAGNTAVPGLLTPAAF